MAGFGLAVKLGGKVCRKEVGPCHGGGRWKRFVGGQRRDILKGAKLVRVKSCEKAGSSSQSGSLPLVRAR